MIPDFRVLITALTDAEVDFIVVGGIALVLHGSARVTRDLGVCYARDRENLKRLAKALKPFGPSLRGAPVRHGREGALTRRARTRETGGRTNERPRGSRGHPRNPPPIENMKRFVLP